MGKVDDRGDVFRVRRRRAASIWVFTASKRHWPLRSGRTLEALGVTLEKSVHPSPSVAMSKVAEQGVGD